MSNLSKFRVNVSLGAFAQSWTRLGVWLLKLGIRVLHSRPYRTVPATKAYLSFKGRAWKVPQAFQGQRVAVRPLSTDSQYGSAFGAHQIATIDLTSPESVGDVSEQVSIMSPD